MWLWRRVCGNAVTMGVFGDGVGRATARRGVICGGLLHGCSHDRGGIRGKRVKSAWGGFAAVARFAAWVMRRRGVLLGLEW